MAKWSGAPVHLVTAQFWPAAITTVLLMSSIERLSKEIFGCRLPAIIAESADRYLINLKKVNSQFMTHTFETNERGKSDLAAGTHPRDFTMRAQTVERSANPRFHKLLGLFQKQNRTGGLVNTSFNLHGEPIVRSPEDAIRVLQKSELKYLARSFSSEKEDFKKTKY